MKHPITAVWRSIILLEMVNYDGVLNVSDVILIINLILNEDFNEYSDINQDNVLSVLDVIELVNIILEN